MLNRQRPLRRPAFFFSTALLAGVAGLGAWLDHFARTDAPAPVSGTVLSQRGELGREHASPAVRLVAQWAVDTNDHADLPFLIVDKGAARLYAFDAAGRVQGSTPVLLGATRGDAYQPMAASTPAGRFVAEPWRNAWGDSITWANRDGAVMLHEPSAGREPGRAAMRLASDDERDRRISDGSLHVGANFWRDHLAGLRGRASVAYVLPELRTMREVISPQLPDDALVAQAPRPAPRRPS